MSTILEEKRMLARVLGVEVNNISQSFLRSEVLLSTTGSIDFNLLKSTANSPTVTSRLLDQNNTFITTHIGLLLKKPTADTAAAHAIAKYYNYVNPATGLFDATEDLNCQAIYNGFLNINIDQINFLPAMACSDFERVPTSQQGQVTALTVTPTSGTIARDGKENGLYGQFPSDWLSFSGTQTVKATVNLPASVAMQPSGEFNYVVLFLRGYLITNYNVAGREALAATV
jgi:hypothetical protein